MIGTTEEEKPLRRIYFLSVQNPPCDGKGSTTALPDMTLLV